MGYLYQYRKLIALLTVWVLVCSLYFFRYVINSSYTRHYTHHYTHVINTAPARDPQEPINSTSSAGRTALAIKTKLTRPQFHKENRNITRKNLNHVPEPTELSKTTGASSKTKPAPNKTLAMNSTTPHTIFNSTTTSKRLSVSVTTAATKNMTSIKTTPAVQTSSPVTGVSLSSPKSKSASSVNRTSTDHVSPKLLCVRFTGRLGNELFEFSSTLGLALALNRTPVFLGSKALRKVLKAFPVPSVKLRNSELNQRCKKAKGMAEVSCCKYKEEMTQLDPQYDYRISMYLQSYRYFDNHTTEIRKAVMFNDTIQTRANKTVQELRQKYKSSTLVGTHIRRGDMASKRNKKLGYPAASPEYINKSLSYFSQLYPNCVFVVASDSIDWCKENFPKGYNITYLSGNEPAVDMLILASLDHVIISFGSFSWWIGYLSHGRVVYMKDFITANTHIGSAFNPKGRDYIYPGWTPL